MKKYMNFLESKQEKIYYEKAPSMQRLVYNDLNLEEVERPPEGCECIIFKQESKHEIKETGMMDQMCRVCCLEYYKSL